MRRVPGNRLLLPFMLISVLALLEGLWAGLVRIGWAVPVFPALLPLDHGPLMVSGFLGSLIALERVAALRRGWMYISPLLTGAGWVLSLAVPATTLGPVLITLGSAAAVLILVVIIQREPALHTSAIGLGAACWLVGNFLWLGGLPIYRVVLWWAAFLIFTIAGERLELSRVLRMTPLKLALFLLAAGAILAGAGVSLVNMPFGARLAGQGMLGLSAWLLWFDIARRNLRHPAALTRYIARCLYTGYFWLAAGGALSLWLGAVTAGPAYDAVLHSLFIGFVISMIFGHAPIIIPALTGRMLSYHPAFSGALVLLHASLVARVVGDLASWPDLRRWGGLLNEVSILLFLILLVGSVVRQAGSERGKAAA